MAVPLLTLHRIVKLEITRIGVSWLRAHVSGRADDRQSRDNRGEGSIPPVAAVTFARLASAEVGSLALAMLTPAKRHDERGRV